MVVKFSFSQNELNGYKYILVPKKYDFLKGDDDRYKLNSLTKFLFNKNGFTTLFQDEDYPEDLRLNMCLGLVVDIANDSKVFTTRLKIELKDCYNKTVYTSIEGSSREKEYEKAYQEALRKSFVSYEAMNYRFDPALVANLTRASKTNPPVNPVIIETNSPPKEEPKVNDQPVVVPFKVIESEEAEEIEAVNAEQPESNKPKSKQTEPVTEAKPAAVEEPTLVPAPVPAPVPVKTNDQEKSNESKTKSGLKSYKNENISFFIIDQGENLMAYVNETKDGTYKKGELIGTFNKTSIPNVYRVTWKDKEGSMNETTGYFDDAGNLKVDVNRNGKIEVIVFELEK